MSSLMFFVSNCKKDSSAGSGDSGFEIQDGVDQGVEICTVAFALCLGFEIDRPVGSGHSKVIEDGFGDFRSPRGRAGGSVGGRSRGL